MATIVQAADKKIDTLKAQLTQSQNTMQNKQKTLQDIGQSAGTDRFQVMIDGTRYYNNSRFEQRAVTQADAFCLMKLADYAETMVKGIVDPLSNSLSPNAYPMKICQYYQRTQPYLDLQCIAATLYEDFQKITKHLSQAVHMDNAQREKALVWFQQTCPGGIFELWQAILEPLMKSADNKERQKLLDKFLGLLDAAILTDEEGHEARSAKKAWDEAKKTVDTLEEKIEKLKEKHGKDIENLEKDITKAEERGDEDKEQKVKEKLEKTEETFATKLGDSEEKLDGAEGKAAEKRQEYNDKMAKFEYAKNLAKSIVQRLEQVAYQAKILQEVEDLLRNVLVPIRNTIVPQLVAFEESNRRLDNSLRDITKKDPAKYFEAKSRASSQKPQLEAPEQGTPVPIALKN